MATAARPAKNRESRKNGTPSQLIGAKKCRRKFLRFFPGGFTDETYLDWERNYKWEAHERWETSLGRDSLGELLGSGQHEEAARRAVAVESRTNLLFSFEKMALRDGVKTRADRKSTRLNSSHGYSSYAVFCLKKKKDPWSASATR